MESKKVMSKDLKKADIEKKKRQRKSKHKHLTILMSFLKISRSFLPS